MPNPMRNYQNYDERLKEAIPAAATILENFYHDEKNASGRVPRRGNKGCNR